MRPVTGQSNRLIIRVRVLTPALLHDLNNGQITDNTVRRVKLTGPTTVTNGYVETQEFRSLCSCILSGRDNFFKHQSLSDYKTLINKQQCIKLYTPSLNIFLSFQVSYYIPGSLGEKGLSYMHE